MIKPDEIEFMKLILSHKGRYPSQYWEAMTKRQHRILEKWSDKGQWEYGVSVRSGWLTEVGYKHLEASSITQVNSKAGK